MAERFEELYEFNIQGNFREELERLRTALADTRAGWQSLRSEVGGRPTFGKSLKEIKELRGAARTSAEELRKFAGEQVKVASANATLAAATNRLTQEQNQLTVQRKIDLITLEQERSNAAPRIVRLRAEAKALRVVTKALTEKAFKEELATFAAQNGLQVSADGKRIFDAEATALERLAKANQELAVSRILASKGADARGVLQQQGPPLPPELLLQQRAQLEFQKEIDRLRTRDAVDKLKEQSEEYKRLSGATAIAETRLRSLTTQGEKTQSVFNRVSFTFRRLIGIMAVFTIARVAVREFNNLVASGVRLNSELEQIRVGVAGLIAAAGQVRNVNGEVVDVNRSLEISQNLAIDQIQKLRGDALRTVATYQDLAKAFQTAIAPGLSAGLTLDQIRTITVDISQAATALGVAQDQLAEEIRSLFQGTITPRNTRIATALGISNEDIRRAKEAGQLAQFLENRFAAISAQGEKLMNTFAGSVSNALDAFQQLLAESSGPLFEQLKGAFQQVQDLILEQREGTPVVDPEVREALQQLYTGLARGVQGIQAAFAGIDLRGVADSLSLIGETLGLIATVGANAFKIVFNAASPVIGVFSSLLGIINTVIAAISGIPGSGLIADLVKQSSRILVAWILIRGAILKGAAALGAIRKLHAAVLASMRGQVTYSVLMQSSLTKQSRLVALLGASWRKLLLPIAAVAVAIAAIDGLLRLFNVDFQLGDFIAGLFGQVDDALDKLGVGIGAIEESAKAVNSADTGQVVNDFRTLNAESAELSRTLRQNLANAITELGFATRAIGVDSAAAAQLRDMAAAQEEVTEKVLAFQQELDQTRKRIEQLNELGKSNLFGEPSGRPFVEVREQLTEIRKQIQELEDTAASRKIAILAAQLAGASEIELSPQVAQYKRDEAEIAKLKQVQVTAEEELKSLGEQRKTSSVNLKIAKDQEAAIEKEIQDLTRQTNELLNIRLLKTAQQANFQSEQQLRLSKASLQAAQAEAQAAILGGTLLSERLSKEAALAQVQAEATNTMEQLNRTTIQTLFLLGEVLQKGGENAAETANALRERLGSLEREKAILEEINQATKLRAKRELEIAQLRESGTSRQGFSFGLDRFGADNASQFDIGERFGKSMADGVTNFAGSAISESVVAAFDPSRNFNLRESLGNLALELGNQLLTDQLKFGLAKLLGLGQVANTGGTAATGAVEASRSFSAGADISDFAKQEAAATALSTAATGFGTAVTGFGTSVTGLGGSVATFATAVGTFASAVAASSGKEGVKAVGALAGAAADNATGGKILAGTGFATAAHRNAPGFAIGGRPRNVDVRDTVPAWLRPGEWVIRPEAVRKYGDGLFDMLNRGLISPNALKGIRSSGPTIAAPRRQSFATGGAVAPAARPRAERPVMALQFYDEQVMDRALAAGSQSTVRFARKRKTAYRAALGLEG